jgi:hypothetical protein
MGVEALTWLFTLIECREKGKKVDVYNENYLTWFFKDCWNIFFEQ